MHSKNQMDMPLMVKNSVDDEHIIQIRDLVSKEDGLLLCPEGAATAAGYQLAIKKKIISPL